MAAALSLSLGHSLHLRNSSIQELNARNRPRIAILVSCCQRDDLSNKETKQDKQHQQQSMRQQVLKSVEMFGKRLKDNLSPKQKGDWKDLTLMCLSFAVYVYMSQKLVCAYCVWMSMVKQPW